ncbi:MAG: 2-oxo acid dehydrogenase subunit E2 [Acidobacteria bacterium]|nr:MAG: 2-oxo acid dehydrogenase subunit E2 [Acidobacteriota bacterium]REK08569.1 MAG: 2-oxo acid dehydrogenase subunit E2 [Acidobacteriota bacterium]
MSTEIIMPQMGESIAEGTITKWLAAVGDRVERDQPLLEISTDKVDAEIPSPASGTLLEILFQEGETVEVDAVIGRIGAAGSEPAKDAVPAPSQAGEAAEDRAAAAAPGSATAAGAQPDSDDGPMSLDERTRRFSSPVVRKIASEHGVDIAEIEGSGIGGRVTKQDILAYLEQQPDEARPEHGPGVAAEEPARAAAAASAEQPRAEAPPRATASQEMVSRQAETPATGAAPAARSSRDELSFSVPAYTPNERVEIEPMSRIRRLTAAHMLYSQETSAHVTTVFDVDLSGVVAARDRAKAGFQAREKTKLTYMPFFFKAVIDGLKTYPVFNASVDGTNIVYKQDINLGMAVAMEHGLIVPVIKRAANLNLVGLASAANDLADRARARQLKPDEVQGGTFTITNPGVFGSLFGTPLVNQPQVAILCLGAIEKRAVVLTDENGNDSIGIRPMAYLALSYDHRLIDGADAEQFMVRVKQTLTGSRWEELESYR